MKTINIVGVPEHFNLPWHLCIESGEFENAGINLQWTDVPEGTGKMCKMLRESETDLAVILTEGIVKDITDGNESQIIQKYVESPLIWGVHIGANSPYKTPEDLKDKKVAVSRMGSGSHLMAYVYAENMGWDTSKMDFEIVHTIDGAVKALTNGTADYFMWEKFMTKPLVDSGVFRKIDDCPTPWPCFVIVGRKEFLKENVHTVNIILEIINATTQEFKNIPSIDRTLSNRYNQKIEDIREWLLLTSWSQKNIDEKTLTKVQNQLYNLSLIDKKITFAEMVFQL